MTFAVVTDFRAWPTRPNAQQLCTDRDNLEALLRHRPPLNDTS